MSDFDTNLIKNKYSLHREIYSDEDSRSQASSEKMGIPSMRVTFSKKNKNEYSSQDRKRRKKIEIDINPRKSPSLACHTVARNSHRGNHTIVVSE